jgi:hypothetical protein
MQAKTSGTRELEAPLEPDVFYCSEVKKATASFYINEV